MADMFSRRAMIVGAGAATAGVVGVAGSDAVSKFAASLRQPAAGARRGVALKTASYQDWVLQVGTNFTLETGHVLKLASVQSFPNQGPRPSNLRSQAFVARFDVKTAPRKAAALVDRIFRVAHPQGGTFDMFLSNVDPKKGLKLIAIFN